MRPTVAKQSSQSHLFVSLNHMSQEDNWRNKLKLCQLILQHGFH